MVTIVGTTTITNDSTFQSHKPVEEIVEVLVGSLIGSYDSLRKQVKVTYVILKGVQILNLSLFGGYFECFFIFTNNEH